MSAAEDLVLALSTRDEVKSVLLRTCHVEGREAAPSRTLQECMQLCKGDEVGS